MNEPVISVSESIKAREAQLRDILTGYAVPDPSIVGTLPKGGRQLSFVGHADITRILIEIDPLWYWEPMAEDGGVPAIKIANGFAHMAGTLYIHGIGRTGIGSVQEGKQDLYKELVSDFLRNAAMRFGIALKLWSNQEWDDLKESAQENWSEPAPKAQPRPQAKPEVDPDTLLDDDKLGKINAFIVKRGQNPVEVYRVAGLKLGKATVGDLPKLRAASDQLASTKVDE